MRRRRPSARAEIISTLARRAYRRTVTDREVAALLGFYERARAKGGFDAGIQTAIEALLMTPNFLLRVAQDPAGVRAGTNYKVDAFELASRLSFFLWSSMPDDELLRLAVGGQPRRIRRCWPSRCSGCWPTAARRP